MLRVLCTMCLQLLRLPTPAKCSGGNNKKLEGKARQLLGGKLQPKGSGVDTLSLHIAAYGPQAAYGPPKQQPTPANRQLVSWRRKENEGASRCAMHTAAHSAMHRIKISHHAAKHCVHTGARNSTFNTCAKRSDVLITLACGHLQRRGNQ